MTKAATQTWTLTLLLHLFTATLFGQNFADKDYYLIDSLNLEALTEIDRHLVDSCLKVYHKAKEDTSKIHAIEFIIGESWDDKVWPKYNQWVYLFVKEGRYRPVVS